MYYVKHNAFGTSLFVRMSMCKETGTGNLFKVGNKNDKIFMTNILVIYSLAVMNPYI